MNNFKVGQKVVYVQISLPELGLIKGQIYTVLATQFCCEQSIDVGVVGNHDFTHCWRCKAILNINDRHFLSHEGFKPLIENQILENELTSTSGPEEKILLPEKTEEEKLRSIDVSIESCLKIIRQELEKRRQLDPGWDDHTDFILTEYLNPLNDEFNKMINRITQPNI